jgi:hypothetical protein
MLGAGNYEILSVIVPKNSIGKECAYASAEAEAKVVQF